MDEKIIDGEEQKKGKLRERIKKVVIAGVKFLTAEKKIIEKDQIESILPHRKGKLFLDRVIITPKKVIGEFSITAEACEGHEIGGQLLFRGVDYPEMTAQLLGVWLSQHPNLNGKLAFLRKASFKCIGPTVPGDLLRVEIPVTEGQTEEEEGNPRIESVGSQDRPGRLRQQVIGLNAEAWVGDRKKAVIYFTELGITDAKGLAE